MRIHNSFTRDFTELPPAPSKIGIYVCGITPYDRPHLGHARAAVIFDAFARFLRERGYDVTYVRNITDIDDKIIAAGADVSRYLDEYNRLINALGCLPPDREPKVTEHIPEIIALIETLVRKGNAYSDNGSVLFSIASFPAYGRLSHCPSEEGADFALWKAAKPGEPKWDSPWGPGRPGWHIECSAMAMKYLGESFEIHGGGHDLIFPHHENEIAQSEAATGKPYAKIWMHNGLISIAGRKMSKSLGNAPDVAELLERFGPRAIRFYLLSHHYAAPLDYSDQSLEAARNGLERFDVFHRGSAEPDATVVARFISTLDDNFNTPAAIATLFDAVREGNKSDESARARIRGAINLCGEMIGLDLAPPEESDAEIDRLVAERDEARRARNFARADAVRGELVARGIILEDTPQGTRWRR